MKEQKRLESKIRIHAIIIYVIVAIICAGMVLYVYSIRADIDEQKSSIEGYLKDLSLTNQLIQAVNESQNEVNLYMYTKNYQHYKQFREKLDNMELLIDTLLHVTENQVQEDRLRQIGQLLLEKGRIISNLNKLLSNSHNSEEIKNAARSNKPILVTPITPPELIPPSKQKSFWDKLPSFFARSKKDSLETEEVIQPDTLVASQPDTTSVLLEEMSEVAKQAQKEYRQTISSIEKNLSDLIASDQKISTELSTLLIDFHSQMVQTRFGEIRKSEQLIRKNNTYTIASGIIAMVLTLMFIYFIINDVNKGYKARQSLEKANERIKQIMDTRHQFLLSVSHDIKTPLGSILGIIDLKKSPDNMTADDIHTMQNSGKHILNLLENLLEFSSIEQGKVTVIQQNFNLYALCQEIIDLFIPLAQQKNLELNHSFDFEKELTLASDALKIKQIIINLLSNAIKYTSSGVVSLSVSYRHGSVYFQVEDTGSGISQEDIKRIFEPFSRVNSQASISEGSGLGLYVVQGLVQILKGDIKVSSRLEIGSSFEVTIPAEVIASERPFFQRSILIVDDDLPYLLVLRDSLLQLGHIPSTAHTREEFEKQFFSSAIYDEILTDMEMGTFNGLDVLHAVKNSKKHTTVSLMTARKDIPSEEYLRKGFSSILIKPISSADLAQLYGASKVTKGRADSLREMLGNDIDSIKEVLLAFVTSTEEHIQTIHTAVSRHDFNAARAACHKMIPMFKQLDATEKLPLMIKMESHPISQTDGFPHWEKEMNELTVYAQKVVEQIKDEIRRLS